MCPQADTGEDNGWWIILPSAWVVCFLHMLCIPDAISLQNATLAWSRPSAMAAGDASQTTPVQITHVFVLCCLIPVRALVITWCALIN